jgi:hypothetical protein
LKEIIRCYVPRIINYKFQCKFILKKYSHVGLSPVSKMKIPFVPGRDEDAAKTILPCLFLADDGGSVFCPPFPPGFGRSAES